jgi:hypothetical protein
MPRRVAQLSGLIVAVVIGMGMVAWILRPASLPTKSGGRPSGSGSASVVYLDAEGRAIVPDDPPGVSEQNAGDAIANAAVTENPLPKAAPGGGEMVEVGNRLRHYSVARRAGDAGLHIGCAGDLPRAVADAGDE